MAKTRDQQFRESLHKHLTKVRLLSLHISQLIVCLYFVTPLRRRSVLFNLLTLSLLFVFGQSSFFISPRTASLLIQFLSGSTPLIAQLTFFCPFSWRVGWHRKSSWVMSFPPPWSRSGKKERDGYTDAKLLLPYVSVTAFRSDSTSKPAPP